MMPMTYNNIVLDIAVPMVFILSLYMIAKGLTYIPVVKEILSSVGNSTFTIFFTHAAILTIWYEELSILSVFVAIVSGWGVHSVFNHFYITKLLFIGK